MRPSATTLDPEITDAELAAMLRALHVAPLRGPHLEIGTAAGGTLRALMLTYSAEHRPQFVVVDPMTYFPDQLSIVRRNLASAGIDPDSVEFRISKSWPAFQRAMQSGERFSFIFIDASHKAHRVMQDICWARLLEPGGLLCFHDYTPGFPGVVFAVDRLLSANTNYEIVEHAESMLILRKAAAGKPEVRWHDLIAAQFVNLGHQIAAGVRRRIGRTRPILAHNTFSEMFTRHSSWRIDPAVYVRMQRILGADWIVTPGAFGNPGVNEDELDKVTRAVNEPFGKCAPCMPICATISVQSADLISCLSWRVGSMGTRTGLLPLVRNLKQVWTPYKSIAAQDRDMRRHHARWRIATCRSLSTANV